MVRYLLDTGLVIRHLRGQKNIVQLLRNLGKRQRLGIAAVTRLEIHAGMHPDEVYQTQKLLSRFVTYDLDSSIADRAGDYIREYRAKHTSLAIPDAIIAATAITYQLTLVTLNVKDFPMSSLSILPLPSEPGF